MVIQEVQASVQWKLYYQLGHAIEKLSEIMVLFVRIGLYQSHHKNLYKFLRKNERFFKKKINQRFFSRVFHLKFKII